MSAQFSTSKNRGFTLIELLTVIAIIAILAAILMPTLTRVREAANSAHCVSNLRTMASAVQAFASDNNDHYPFYIEAIWSTRSLTDEQAQNHPYAVGVADLGRFHARQWDAQIAPYMDVPSPFDFLGELDYPADLLAAFAQINSFDHPFWCRSTGRHPWDESLKNNSWYDVRWHAQTSYAYNANLGGWGTINRGGRFQTLSTIQYPMLIPMIGDLSWPIWRDGGDSSRTLFDQASGTTLIRGVTGAPYLAPRHGGQVNILFADFSIQPREIADQANWVPYRIKLMDGDWDVYIEPADL